MKCIASQLGLVTDLTNSHRNTLLAISKCRMATCAWPQIKEGTLTELWITNKGKLKKHWRHRSHGFVLKFLFSGWWTRFSSAQQTKTIFQRSCFRWIAQCKRNFTHQTVLKRWRDIHAMTYCKHILEFSKVPSIRRQHETKEYILPIRSSHSRPLFAHCANSSKAAQTLFCSPWRTSNLVKHSLLSAAFSTEMYFPRSIPSSLQNDTKRNTEIVLPLIVFWRGLLFGVVQQADMKRIEDMEPAFKFLWLLTWKL